MRSISGSLLPMIPTSSIPSAFTSVPRAASLTKAGFRRITKLSTSCGALSRERNSVGVPAWMIATSPLTPEVR